jgi:anti-sigma B factor antagonist
MPKITPVDLNLNGLISVERILMEFITHENYENDIVVIDIPERLTSDTSDTLKHLLKELIDRGKYRFIMNMANTRYMDSSGLGAVVSKIASTRSKRGDIRLAVPQQYVKDLLNLTHINQILQSFDTVELAIKSFRE